MINELLTLFEKDLKACWEKIKTIIKPDDWFFQDKYRYIESALKAGSVRNSDLKQIRLRIKLIIDDLRLMVQNHGIGGETVECKSCGATFPRRPGKDFCSDCSYKRNLNRRILLRSKYERKSAFKGDK